MEYTTKDSGERKEWSSGFRRDTDKGKPRYDLIPLDCFKRLGELYMRGAEKYGDRNWESAKEPDAIDRFRQSAFRHFIQWMAGEDDEDHGSAVVFNIFAYEHLKRQSTLK